VEMDVLFVKDVEEEEHSAVDFARFVNVPTIHQHDPIYLEIHFVLLQNKKNIYRLEINNNKNRY